MAMILVLSMMLMGAGYAAWTNTMDVTADVDTGELKLEYLDVYTNATDPWYKYQNSQYDVKANTFKFTYNNIYPGIELCVNQRIQNKGTIPAIFDKAIVKFHDDISQELKDDLVVSINWYQIRNADGSYHSRSSYSSNFALKDLQEKLTDELKGVRLEPGQTLELGGEQLNKHFDIYLPSTTGNETESKSVGFTITMMFKQFNK